MAQSSKPWDGIAVGDAIEAPYSSNEWAHIWNMLHGVGSIFPNYGIIPGTGDGTHDPLQVLQTSVASVNVEVHVGAALVNGKLYESDATEQLAVGANASGNPRIDLVVLRIDYTAQTIRQVIKQGTPAGSPVRPALIQSASIWEIPLADIAVANGFSTITQVNITDSRRGVSSANAGWQLYAYPMNYLFGVTSYTGHLSRYEFLQPIVITGNMLVKQLILRSAETAVNRAFKWGIYTQHANDQNVADTFLYFVGGWGNVSYTVDVANGYNFILPAKSVFYLPPGHYWLAVENSNVVDMPYYSFSSNPFEISLNSMLVPSLDNFTTGLPIDTVDVGFVPIAEFIPARIEGVIFGDAP